MAHAPFVWIPQATNIHSEYVIRIAFTRQHWLQQRAPGLRYTQISCLLFLCTEGVLN